MFSPPSTFNFVRRSSQRDKEKKTRVKEMRVRVTKSLRYRVPSALSLGVRLA